MHATYAITTVTWQRKPIFTDPETAQKLLNTLIHYRNNARYELHAFAIMPEHIHVLITTKPAQTIERCRQCIKGGFSHSIRGQFPHPIWQPNYHAHRIRDLKDFNTQRAYIAQNPIRRNLTSCLVHTNYPDRIDFLISDLAAQNASNLIAAKPASP